MRSEKKLYATGSRTAAFVGVADTINAAEQMAEEEISRIKFPCFIGKILGLQN